MPARRLRTLMLRLVAHGHVGANGIEPEAIFMGLPEIHRQSLQNVLPVLLEAEFLVRVAPQSTNREHVAVNPNRLADVQALVNREMLPAWIELAKS